jgi:hypothetical protein
MNFFNKVLTATYIVAILAMTAVLATDAKADTQYSTIIHLASKHGSTADNYKFNEVNPGFAIRAEFDRDMSIQGGVYKNSYKKTTAYAALQYTPVKLGNVRFGGFAGMGTGYTAHSVANVGPLSALAGAMAVANFGKMSLTFRGAPKLGSGTASVVAIEVGYKF